VQHRMELVEGAGVVSTQASGDRVLEEGVDVG
jgi:hypothetical protein